MKILNEQHENLMRILDEVSGVQEHMKSCEVEIGNRILEQRLKKGLTQFQVAEIIKRRDDSTIASTLSKVECGDKTISLETYRKVLKYLKEM